MFQSTVDFTCDASLPKENRALISFVQRAARDFPRAIQLGSGICTRSRDGLFKLNGCPLCAKTNSFPPGFHPQLQGDVPQESERCTVGVGGDAAAVT